MNHKLIEAIFLMLSCLLFFCASFFVTDKLALSSSPLGISGESFPAMTRQSARSRISNPDKNASLYFKFTENQRVHLKNEIASKGAVCVVATIKTLGRRHSGKKSTVEKNFPFQFGFLYVKSSGGQQSYAPGNNFISGDYALFDNAGIEAFTVSLTLGKNDVIPAGFFLHSSHPCAIDKVTFGEARLGWDFSSAVPVYAFSSKGGTINMLSTASFDFSVAEGLFPASNSQKTVLPKIAVTLAATDDAGTWNKQRKLYAHYGSEEFAIRRHVCAQKEQHTLQLSAFDSGYSKLDFGSTNEVLAMMMSANNTAALPRKDGTVLHPLVTDLGLIPDWPKKNWRTADYELFEWEEVPHVLFFDFADYSVQSDFLTRLAYFAEKTGYKGTLVDDEFVATHHGYNAHDYRDRDLAAFFTLTAQQGFQLNSRELLLRDILLANGVIKSKKDGTYEPGVGAVVSISRESADYLRWQFLSHESWHGIYFTSEVFRREVDTVYDSFDPVSLDFIQTFWETQPGLNYDRTDDYLMRNEFMAYIMQQGLSNVGPYFVGLAKRDSVNRIEGPLASYIRDTEAGAFVRAGQELNAWAFENYGFAAGRVNLVYRIYPD